MQGQPYYSNQPSAGDWNQQQYNIIQNLMPKQQIAVHYIRNNKSWEKIIDEANNWINSNIHVKRVISISTILCHTTSQGMITIYYDKSNQLDTIIQQYSGYKLMYKILRTSDKWQNQISNTVILARHHSSDMNRLISINQLEVNEEHHEDALSVIWYMMKI